MELFHAHQQWATRPDDERFPSVQALYDATVNYARTALERPQVRIDSLRVEAIDGDVQIVGRGDVPAKLTHWSFGQLAGRVKAPADYLRSLPATLAAQNLNYGLAKRVKDDADATVNLLLHKQGTLMLRALTSDRYSRIWNFEVAERLIEMEARGWLPATPDFNRFDDKLPLYASDHDMFAFIVHPDRVIKEPNNPEGLRRGLIVSNSEVGGGKLKLLRFLYRAMCGNHIIWGAEDVAELSAIHVGERIHQKFDEWKVEIVKYLDESASAQEQAVIRVMTKRIAGSKDELLDALFSMKSLGLSRRVLEAGYASAMPDEDGDPLTPWGIVQGLTRYSQQTPFADERMAIDNSAGKILAAF
jgi:hypothetical protein